MTWLEEARVILARVDAALPAGTDLKERRKACLAAKPHWFASTSWGTKVWQKAQREYLEKHGLPRRAGKPVDGYLSPLDRMKAAAQGRLI